MKTSNRFLIIILILSILIISCKKDGKKVGDGIQDNIHHKITLYVNTDSINKNNIDTMCNFGQPDSISNVDFTIYAHVGDSITWIGETTPPSEGLVNIKKIKHEKGKNVFNSGELDGEKKIKAKVAYKTKENEPYKYKLKFEVVQPDGTKKEYHIDPKIQVN